MSEIEFSKRTATRETTMDNDPMKTGGTPGPLFTSRQVSDMAYESVKPARLNSVKNKLIQALAGRPQTDDELELMLDMSHQTVSASRRSLVKSGLVESTGNLRPTRTGRQAQVWRLKDGGGTVMGRSEDGHRTVGGRLKDGGQP